MAELAPLPFALPDPKGGIKRDAKGRIVAGSGPLNPTGRPIEDGELKAQCRIASEGYVQFLLGIQEDPDELTANRLAAGRELADRGYGKSISRVETGKPNEFSEMTDEQVSALAIELAQKAVSEGTIH